MKILEFGDKTKEKIILIHGFQSPYQVWNKYIKQYEDDFHIIVPIVSGHDPLSKDEFVSFEEDAKELENYIISNYGTDIYAIFGMSMGGVLAGTLWKRNKLNIKKIIFDGSPIVSIGKVIKLFVVKTYKTLTKKTKKRDKKTLKKAEELLISQEHMSSFLEIIDNMTYHSIDECLNDIARFHITKNNKKDIELHYFYGTTINELYAKKSAKFLKKYYPNTKVTCFKGKGHCQISMLEPEKMLEILKEII